jgi:hypothetical protein
MQRVQAILKERINALLACVKAAEEAEENKSELNISAEIDRREARPDMIRAAKSRQKERQRQADAASRSAPRR